MNLFIHFIEKSFMGFQNILAILNGRTFDFSEKKSIPMDFSEHGELLGAVNRFGMDSLFKYII